MSETAGPGKGMHRTTRWFLSCMGYVFLVIVLLALAGPVTAVPVLTIDNSSATAIASNLSNVDPGGVLILNPGTYFEAGLVISQGITLRANTSYGGTAANTIIWGGGGSSTLTVDPGVTMVIDNLTFQNGWAMLGSGGAINNAGTLTITSSTFSNCGPGGPPTLNGGAIENTGILSITSSTFSGCYAAQIGSAIHNSATLIVTSTRFISCSGVGTIYSTGTTTITSSTFISCTGKGGAIYSEGTTTITSSTFSGCSTGVGNPGGAIYIPSGTVNITSSTFISCSADKGGAIYTNGGTTTITSSTFSGCSAITGGGAIYIDHSGSPSLTMNFCRIYDCNSGIAVYESAPLSIDIKNNWWGSNDGAVNNVSSVSSSDYTPWLMLGTSATPASITGAQTSLINTNLTWDSDGIYHNPASGHVPDGIAVSFSSTSGTLAPASGSLVSGANATRFTPAVVGTTNISATVDGQTVYTLVTVILTPPVAAFTGTPTAGAPPLTVMFNETSTNSPTTWNWSFGDGSVWFNTTTAAQRNATHTYAAAGTYTVSLIASNADGPDTLTRAGYITVAAPPTPVPTTQAPVQVPPASDPGDGSSSDSIPSPFYPSVSLTVNIGGNSAVGHAEVTGSGINDLIITGLTLGSPGPNIPPPPGTVYQFIGLVPARFTSITAAAITFTVPAAWLEENGILPGNVVLYHYENGAWVALPTTVVSTANGIVKFTATSPGFSLFAIAGQPGTNVTVTLTATPQVQMFGSQVAQSVPAPATVTPAPVMQQTTAAPATIQPPAALPIPTIVLVAAGIMALVGGGFMVRRWWIRRQNPALFAEDE